MVSGGAGARGDHLRREHRRDGCDQDLLHRRVLVAALIAVLLGFSPKFGAVIQTIPLPVMGGVSIVVFGLIAVAGAKIWVDNKVDFSQNKNLIVAAITLIWARATSPSSSASCAGRHWYCRLWRHRAVRAAQPQEQLSRRAFNAVDGTLGTQPSSTMLRCSARPYTPPRALIWAKALRRRGPQGYAAV